MRLDRYDSYLATFHARVTDVSRDERGTWVRLDRSAFYPHAGGQPHDVGTLTSAVGVHGVVEVEARGDDDVWHLLANGLGAADLRPGTEVAGAIDWSRRWRHMQRHSAQHVLSQALVRVSPAFGTVAVSMRGPDCTIDVGGDITAEHLAAAEAEANAAARRNLPITTFEVDESRLGEYALRRPAKVGGAVRLVAIGQYDIVACGGTHLRSSAEALPIKLLGFERVRGGASRITFRAGEEAMADYGAKHEAATALGRLLSAQVPELAPRTEKLVADLSAAGREAAQWRGRLAGRLVAELRAGAEDGVLSAVLEGPDAALLPDVIEACQALAGTVSLLAAVEDGSARVAFVAGPGVQVDVRPALADALAALGGRGGGRPDRAQGAAAGGAEEVRAALSAARALVARARAG